MIEKGLNLWAKSRQAVFIFCFYFIVTQISQTLLYTIVTYFVSTSGKIGVEFGNTSNEIAEQYLFFSLGLGAVLVALTLWLGDKALYRNKPFWNDGKRSVFHLDRLTKAELIRGISSGFVTAAVYLFVFTFANQLSYLGIYLTSTFGTPIFPLFFLDLFSLLVLVFCEEYIFRHKILRNLLRGFSPLVAVFICSWLYTLIKQFQFHLNLFDTCSVFFLNLTVGLFFLRNMKIHRGLAFLGSLLIALHTLAGLPLWGREGPSFFLFKRTTKASEFLSGGELGPFSGLGLFSIIFVLALSAYFSWKRSATELTV